MSLPSIDDRELVLLAIKNDWPEYDYASMALREDRAVHLSFLLSRQTAELCCFAELHRDHELLTAAIANTSAAITAYFGDDDLEYLSYYATMCEIGLVSTRTCLLERSYEESQ